MTEAVQWYHSLELGDGTLTPGWFDLRSVARRLPWPDLAGKRCLDVATFDGFWAFEMERRGGTVTALDIADPDELDWPAALRAGHDRTLDETKAARFALVREALGSRVERVERSVYDLDATLGAFDVVLCSDLLLHLRDPVRALERIRGVCAELAVVVNPIKRFRFHESRPLAELDGIDGFEWWVTNMAGLVRMARAAGFADVAPAGTFELPLAAAGGGWKGLRGAIVARV